MIDKLDALLPQTQCGQCGYGGCRPYATAIVQQQAAFNLCPPGGISTLVELAKTLARDPNPFLASMQMQQKPPVVAKIRETECIGCTKCIQACPVDAIIGSAKQLHTVILDECTGCELCIAPCPVDCIDLELIPQRRYQPSKAKARFSARQTRLANKQISTAIPVAEKNLLQESNQKKLAIEAAVARAKAKRASQR
jgi:electron transport complex protein RnfB